MIGVGFVAGPLIARGNWNMRRISALWVIVCALHSAIAVGAELQSASKLTPPSRTAVTQDATPASTKEAKPVAMNASPVAAAPTSAGVSGAEFHTGRIGDGQTTYSNAGIVASFVDANEAELGDSLGYLLSAELTASLADAPKDYALSVVSLSAGGTSKYTLNKNYHVSATAMANDYQAPLTFWGIARRQGSTVSVSTFLTLRQELRNSDLLLGVKLKANPASTFQAGLTRTRYDFAARTSAIENIFQRRLVTRGKTVLLSQPRSNAADLTSVEAGTVLVGVAMRGAWYQVKTKDGRDAYVDVDQLKVLPPSVIVNYQGMAARAGPGTHFETRTLGYTQTELEVLDVAVDERGMGWYQVRAANDSVDRASSAKASKGQTGLWIDAEHALPRFSFPAVHFLAGIYYLRAPAGVYRCQYEMAASHFSQFIGVAPISEKNINLAAAHQLYAASKLLSDENCGHDKDKALVAYTAAVALTPYDATAYNLRAVANLDATQLAPEVVADLKSALQLDVQDPATRATIINLQQAIVQGEVTASTDSQRESASLYRTVTREHVARNIARIRQQQHFRLDTKGKRILPAPDADVVLAFLNRSGAPLDVYLLKEHGDAKSDNYYYVNLRDGDQTQLHVAPGTYEIAAEAPDPSVKSIYGEHTYASPSHYELDFQVRLNDAPIAQE